MNNSHKYLIFAFLEICAIIGLISTLTIYTLTESEPKLYKIVCTDITTSERVLSATVSKLRYEGSTTYFTEGNNQITLNNVPCMSYEIKGELNGN